MGLIDTGIDTGHPMFAGKTVTEHFFSGATDETGDKTSHGTAVASVIVGRPPAEFTARVTAGRGVARGADVAMFAIQAGSGGGEYNPISLASLNNADDRWESRINHVTAWSSGARTLDFVNMSVGFQGIIEQYSAQDLRGNFGDTIAALAQSGVTDKTIFVWAAGNGHGDPCDPADFILRDHRRFGNDQRTGTLSSRQRAMLPPPGEFTMLFLDAPGRTRLRTLVNKAFTPKAVDDL